jgi:hypothetical protein
MAQPQSEEAGIRVRTFAQSAAAEALVASMRATGDAAGHVTATRRFAAEVALLPPGRNEFLRIKVHDARPAALVTCAGIINAGNCLAKVQRRACRARNDRDGFPIERGCCEGNIEVAVVFHRVPLQ